MKIKINIKTIYFSTGTNKYKDDSVKNTADITSNARAQQTRTTDINSLII